MVVNGVIGTSAHSPSISIAMFSSGVAGAGLVHFLPENVNAMLCSTYERHTNVNVGESAIRIT